MGPTNFDCTGNEGFTRAQIFRRGFLRRGQCAKDIWIEIGVVSPRTDQFEMSGMLQVIDEKLLLLMDRKTLVQPSWAWFRCVYKDKLINEQILDLGRAAQWVMTRRSTIFWFHRIKPMMCLCPSRRRPCGDAGRCVRVVHHEGHL